MSSEVIIFWYFMCVIASYGVIWGYFCGTITFYDDDFKLSYRLLAWLMSVLGPASLLISVEWVVDQLAVGCTFLDKLDHPTNRQML